MSREHDALLAGGGEMGERIRAFEWGETRIGPAADWPKGLRAAVAIMLGSPQPVCIWWGRDLVQLYNDASIPVLAARHPAALGQPAREVWSEIWPALDRQVDRAIDGGLPSASGALPLATTRDGCPQAIRMTFSFSPIPGDDGRVDGLFCTCTEETERVLGQRRLGTLTALGQRTAEAETAEAACALAASRLGRADGLPSHPATARERCESEPLYRTMFDAAPAMLWVTEPEGSCTFLSRGWYEYTGQTEVEALGFGWLDAVHPEDREKSRSTFLDANARRAPFQMDQRLRRADGQYRWVIDAGRPLEGPGGEPLGYIGSVIEVHERKVAEESLRQSGRRLAAILEQLPVGVGLIDADGTFGVSNSIMRELVPLTMPSRDPQRMHRWRSFDAQGRAVPPDRWPGARALRGESVSPGMELVYLDDDGAEHWRLVTAVPFRSDDGSSGALAVVQDIDDRKRAEAVLSRASECNAFRVALSDALRSLDEPPEIQCAAARVLGARLGASRALYATLLEGGEIAAVEADYCKGVKTLAGRHDLRDYGRTAMAQLRAGRTVAMDDVASDRRLAPAERTATLSLGIGAYVLAPLAKRGRTVAVLAVHHAGPRVWRADEVALIEETAERTWSAVERAQAVAELAESEDRFRTLADNISQLAWMADAQGSIFWYNRRWYEYTGTRYLDMRGWGWTKVHHPDHLERVVAGIQHSWDTGEPWEDLFPLRGRDGDWRWFLSRALPIRDADGRVVRWFGTNTDVTEWRAAEEALREAHRRKDELLATLAHELRNPLAPLRNGLEILRLAGTVPGTFDKALGMMERQLGNLVQLVDDLLDLSRISRGKIELRRERLSLGAAVESALETVRPLVDAEGHALDIRIPEEPITVDADPLRLAQVFVNLLNNAVKYTPPGGRIAISVERLDGEAQVTVADNGVGIPAYMLPKIFEMFAQERSTERGQGGLGIGLHIVRRLTEMHGGSVEAKSDGPGQGSAFAVRLPLARDRAGLDEPVPLGALESAPEPGSGSRRILVVDDNRDVADSLELMLRVMGHEVRTAYSGVNALEMAGSFRPEIVVLDIGMPDLDGYETAERLRQLPWQRQPIIVALTGWGQEDARRRSRAAGFDHHLVKPVDRGALATLLAGLSREP